MPGSIPANIEPVTPFDVENYLGTWYEIARLDHFFERGLTRVTVTRTFNQEENHENQGYANTVDQAGGGIMSRPKQYFRAGAGAVIINRHGLVLALERADVAGSWQMPQGGLDAAEEPLAAAYREVAEETGITAADLELLDTYPEPLVYELPVRMRTEKTGRGQVQYWYLFRFNGQDGAIDAITGGEFRAWRWTTMQQLLHTTPDFRISLYHKLGQHFAPHLA